MEKKLGLCALVVSPIVAPLSATIKFRTCSLTPALVVSGIFAICSLLAQFFSKKGKEKFSGLLLKFLSVGFYVGLQISVFIEIESNTLTFLQILSNTGSIFFAILLVIMPLRESNLLRFPYLFSDFTENISFIDTMSTIIISECLGYVVALYLGLAYLSSSWLYYNLYAFSFYGIVAAVILMLISKPLTTFLLKKQKKKQF